MNVFKAIGNFFLNIGNLVKQAFTAAVASGVTDKLIAEALKLVKEAALKVANNTEKREWVVAQLVKAKVPESLARLAVELAYNLFKKELDQIGNPPTA